jgi:hypothetical protein
MGEQHPRIEAGISEGDRPWARVDLTPATLPRGVSHQQLHIMYIMYIRGDYFLSLDIFGPDKPDKSLPDFCGMANFRFRSIVNGGGSLRYGYPAAGQLLRCLTAAAKADASQLQPPQVEPNLPWAAFKIDEGSGWLGLFTGPDGAWWLTCLPFAGDGNTLVSDGPSLMSHADDASLLVRVPLELPLPVYEGLRHLYNGLKRDA